MGETDKDKRQIDLIDYIEDAEKAGAPVLHAGPPALHIGPAPQDKTYSDTQLESAGLVAVKAFMRTKRSKNALRVQKTDERRQNGETGPPRKQLNLLAPVDKEARTVIKELTAAMLDEAVKPDDIRAVLTEENMEWKQRCLEAERQLDAAHRQIDQLTAQIKRHELNWLGWPLKYIFRRR